LKRWIILVTIALVVSGCGIRDRIFGSQADRTLPYRASLTKGEDRRDFAVRVRASGISVAQVRESVRFPATRYCLETFGGSDARWALDPATGDWAFTRDGQDMVFRGRCVAR
jgi:hypothetical protein